ncbi:phosphoribosylanthranilate isomerase [Candidatus Symbiothrix dinenymphae]|nr:phosphoribosylanthranilate isomerase [Candidatus Symbiothrix dinenymphae]
MRSAYSMVEVSQLPIDFMGFIFYEKSPRYDKDLNVWAVKYIPASIQKVGVFVNAAKETILETAEKFDLQLVQLHGDESPEFCSALNKDITKVFSIASECDFARCSEYESVCKYFLFDTKTPQFGGSGKKFDWQILSAYKGKTPFFLSGGIAPEDAEAIRQLNFPQLCAVDLNSRFETEPGFKDVEALKRFIQGLAIEK